MKLPESLPFRRESTSDVMAKSDDGSEKKFTVTARVDTPEEVAYYQNGGILTYVLRQMI